MKYSLISATSVFALLSAAIGPAHAGVQSATAPQLNIYDLVHDGMTSADGGDTTVAAQDPSITAVQALEATSGGWRDASFTGPVDSAPLEVARIPLAAARGTRPDDDFATPSVGAWEWDAAQKARAAGAVRIAPLIGTVGTGIAATEKVGNTVFVADSRALRFNQGDGAYSERSSSVAAAFAPSSTSTATITVAGAGNFRQRTGSGFSVAAANSLQVVPTPGEPAQPVMALQEAAQPTLGYNYAPAKPSAKGNAVEASFSDAVTATGVFADVNRPAFSPRIQTSELAPGKTQRTMGGKIETSQLQSPPTQTGQFQVSDFLATFSKMIDPAQPLEGTARATQGDGTRTFLSASVSANPASTAARYMANVVNKLPASPVGQTVEAFQIGPTPGAPAASNRGTTVADPLRGKVVASAGALNNSLALP